VAFLLLCLSTIIATRWINSQKIPNETIRLAIIIFGCIMACRWPISLYTGVLRGLEKQVLTNIISLSVVIIKVIGIIIVILWISNTITAFLMWQLMIATGELLINYFITWYNIPYNEIKYKVFDIIILKRMWSFSSRVSLISIFATVLKQLDKIIMVKMVTLQQLGYYNIAAVMASGIYLFCLPITTAVFPRLSSLYGENKITELSKVYHLSAQYVSLLVAPIAGALIFYSYEIIFAWTNSIEIAKSAYLVLTLLSLATLFNTMMNIPYMLQLASGLTWLPLWNNFIAVIILAPTIFLLVNSVGIIGGAIAWLIFNFIYFNIVSRIMHRYILIDQFKKWFYKDTMPFIITAIFIFGAGFTIKTYFKFNIKISFIIIFISFVLYGLIIYKINNEIKTKIKYQVFN
jgi:O-antigen/teichoic acid export membrane protein